jgi:hypothetical protein
MGFNTLPSERRLLTILERQHPPKWGADYVPSTLATKEEAPSTSRVSTLTSLTWGRTFHAMSPGERDLLIYALYHPSIFEIQEQRMLGTTPSRHPLDDHPTLPGEIRPSMRGTVAVADALGVLDVHPTFLCHPDGDTNKTRARVPFPYQGDILVFFSDEKGIAAVNWTVKNSHEAFERPSFGSRRYKSSARGQSDERARHQIESVYYQDAGIATVRITPKDWDKSLQENLKQLHLWHDRPHSIPADQIEHIIAHFRSCIGTNLKPIEVAIQIATRFSLKLYEVKIALHQAIWTRALRINLFEPFWIDHPLLPEVQDPVTKYASWLRRG